MTAESIKAEIVTALDLLPPEGLNAVKQFVEFLRSQAQAAQQPPYTPVALGGLWKGVEISDEEIAEIRREMWAGFGEDEL